jgi:hypothetical protein
MHPEWGTTGVQSDIPVPANLKEFFQITDGIVLSSFFFGGTGA